MRILKELKNKYETKDIEEAFVNFYLLKKQIEVKNNLLIKSILEKNRVKIREITSIIATFFKQITLLDLIKVFELLIPEEDKKINGAFFTSRLVTNYIVHETITSKNLKICDPSCGCGAFLIEAANYIRLHFKSKIIEVIQNNLYGIDIADYSVRRAKILLTLLALQNGEDVKTIRFNVKQADSLETDWSNLFLNEVKSGGFDVVIGNPPYVKFQDLPNNLRQKLYKNWLTLKTGNYNLYFAFFELGINILKHKGILGYITPNNFFTSLSGIHLREFLAHNKFLYKVVDFNHIKLFEAQTYTCITFLNKIKKETFLYERVEERSVLDKLDNLFFSTINFSDLNNKKWRLLRTIDQENIKKIENTGMKLRDLVDIRVGIATCKDSIYFIEGTTYKDGYYRKNYKGKTYLIEAAVTKPIAKISDFKTQTDSDKNKRKIIFPYKKLNGTVEIIPEKEFKEKYPKCYQYFLIVKDELSNRDKGKLSYREWYAYARTQGLNFTGEKLLTPTFSVAPRFLYEKDRESLFCNGYAVFLREEQDLFSIQGLDLKLLSKILNSKVMDYYITSTSVSIEGGYPCYQKNFIELFGIPTFTDKEILFLKKEADKKKIDRFLIKKYHLSVK